MLKKTLSATRDTTPVGRFAMTMCATAMLSAGPAMADPDTNQLREQVEELQKRIEQIENEDDKGVSIFPEKDVRLTIAGRVNQAFLYADQGEQDQAYVVDNDGSGSRFEFLGETDFKNWTTGTKIVVGVERNSTDEIKFEDVDNGEEIFVRKVNWFIENPTYGYFSIGRGDTAAEDVTHVDLSGTSFAGAGSDVDDIAGGLEFADDNGVGLADQSVAGLDSDADELDDFFDALDGGRNSRVFYETPSFSGFSLTGSLASNEAEDGLQPAFGFGYETEVGDAEIEAAGAWRQEQNEDTDDEFITGSVSVLLASGFNFTAAAGTGDVEDSDADDPTMFFGKVGYTTSELMGFGETAFSFDAYRGENNSAFASANGSLPTATSFGLSFVQSVDQLATEFFVTARQYEIDDVFVDSGAGLNERDVDGLTALISGARVRF